MAGMGEIQRCLKASAFDEKQEIASGSLRRGAVFQPEALKETVVVNRHLSFAQATHRLSSRSSCCGNRKPQTNSDDSQNVQGLPRHQCQATDTARHGAEITVTMTDKNVPQPVLQLLMHLSCECLQKRSN